MKSKFKSIFNLRTQETRIQEKKVALINNQIKTTQEKISNLTNMIHNAKMPNNGKIAAVISAQAIITILRQDIQISIQEEKQYKQILMDETYNLRMMNIELEKSKYLFEEEKKKRTQYLQRQEQNQLDDISQRMSY